MKYRALATALIVCSSSHALDYTWTGKGGDNKWETKANWNPATGIPGSGDDVLLPALSSNLEIILTSTHTVRSLTFDPANPFAYTLKGSTITLDDGGKIQMLPFKKGLEFKDKAIQQIQCNLHLAGDATIGNDNRWYLGNERLEISGKIIGSKTITIDSKQGGCVSFSGDNRKFTGSLVIGNGQFVLGSEFGLGSSTDTIVMKDGSFSVVKWSMSRDFQIVNDAAWTAGLYAGPHTGTIAVQENSTWTYGTGNNTSIMEGPITGKGNIIIKCGLGTTFNGKSPNTLSGEYTITGGLTILAKPAGVNVIAGPLTLSWKTKLQWKSNEQIADDSPLTLKGKEVVLNLNGHQETVGTLNLQESATIDCGDGNNILKLADSHQVAWNLDKELLIRNWQGNKNGGGRDQIIFGKNAQSLSSSQLQCLGFSNPAGFSDGVYTSKILPSGEIVPDQLVRAINPPFELSEKAIAERKSVYDVPGLQLLTGNDSPLKKDLKISFYGDSITWNNSYLGQIRQALDKSDATKDLGVKLINHGVNGGGVLTLRDGDEGTAHFGNTKPQPFAKTIAEDQPDVVVIVIGVNDIWWRKTSPSDFKKSLADLVASAKTANAQVILSTLAVWGDNPLPENLNNAKCDEYSNLIRSVATEHKVTLADVRRACLAYLKNQAEVKLNGSLRFADKGILTGDGVHPNAQGSALIANIISKGISDALCNP